MSEMQKENISHKKYDCNEKYSITSYILFFFIFSFIGWIWEVGLFLFNTGELINRGVMFGPWLPIYGSGGVLILILLRKFFDKPVLTFFLITVLCSIIEYITSWYLEYTKGIRWWDYSSYFLNINGRICLEGSIIFGLGGCAIVYILAPRLNILLSYIPNGITIFLCTCFLFFFTLDFIYTKDHPNVGKGITDIENWNKPSSVREINYFIDNQKRSFS